MYSEGDIDNAVAAGVLPPQTADAFRRYVAAGRASPAVDEEHFRLLTGFNDIFVSIAIVLLLVAVGQIGGQVWQPLAPALVAAVAWALALFFTARRRMALPSIILLGAFVGGVGLAVALALGTLVDPQSERLEALVAAAGALGAAAAAWLHWRRFMVPITVAAGAGSVAGLAVALVLAAFPQVDALVWPLLLAAGLAVFALAMRWDLSDRERLTRRADVAFWLHLTAAPMIAHPVFQLLGVFGEAIGPATAVLVLILYGLFAFVALAVDRRALLVSSLVYVLYAMFSLFRTAGAVELSAAFTALAIGSALLTLSAFWHPIRKRVVGLLGALGTRLPPVQDVGPAIPRPA
ncbi:hypothetical protein Q5H91_05200 [Sphingomonas sp. KR1UV-12]|uniref:DUF2157 domain-containing protein n=1 Tax=Sphingomonas aurea TaxID=3063994 RepID=A0ABT9EI63_9SPHN|nr:hypothetical protein [Sphingomonas sp. KR1UV-12]MDP1026599.1 hypothetical protein [Sphingomonas sp. KR1UV-12]